MPSHTDPVDPKMVDAVREFIKALEVDRLYTDEIAALYEHLAHGFIRIRVPINPDSPYFKPLSQAIRRATREANILQPPPFVPEDIIAALQTLNFYQSINAPEITIFSIWDGKIEEEPGKNPIRSKQIR